MKKEEILRSGVTTLSGAEIFSVTSLPAETTATLHAMNSRQPGGFKVNLPKVFDEEEGGEAIERVMDKFYIGYGHKSIGDCGVAHIYVDGVSMLVPNAFQHWPLYNGQETSSRFVDVTANGYHLPSCFGSIGEKDDWCARWLAFYKSTLPIMIEKIREENPFVTGGKYRGPSIKMRKKRCHIQKNQWEKATKSRALDIMGAFLPCGAKTNFSEVVNLRQWSDQLQILVQHPLLEVREVSEKVMELLRRDHPNSFRVSERDERYEYMKEVAQHLFGGGRNLIDPPDFACDFVKGSHLGSSSEIESKRPRGCDLPFDTASSGWFNISSRVDFRTFRDLHRQRSATWVMPIVQVKHGFESWYLEQLPRGVREKAKVLITEYEEWYQGCGASKICKQYTTPMGYIVPVSVTMPFNAAVYIAELRTAPAVHPTARRWAMKLANIIREKYPIFKLHVCEDPDRFILDRGKHDIVKKEE